MLNRERFLLAVIEELTRKNRLEKLLIQKIGFLFAKENVPRFSFYGFFPYKFGPYSYKIERDLVYFQEKGFITENLQMSEAGKANARILPSQKRFIQRILDEYPSTHELIDTIYQKYPEYTIRSQATNKNPDIKPFQLSDSTPTVFLIGYEKRLVDDFVNILIQRGISILIDVRNNPISMNYDFNRTYLERIIPLGQIQYLNFKELGVPPQIRKELKTTDNQEILAYFKKNLLPKQNIATEKLIDLGKKNRVALLCYERDYLQCHRSVIGDLLQQKGCKVDIIP